MAKEASLDYLIYNSKVCSTEEIEMSNNTKQTLIYEVIRIIDGIPLYLEEHLDRLRKTAKLLDLKIDKTDEELIDEIMKLIDINNEYNSNIKILCYGGEKKIKDMYLYFIKSFYPSKSVHEEGIHTILYKSERENPNAKTFNMQLRQRINRELKERNAFEALLINDRGQITEGSRSNLFFVKDEKLFTPPSDKVLLGVTRTKIIELCRLHNIDIVQAEISSDNFNEYDGAFITGTSINVLPIKGIDEIKFNSSKNDVIIKIIEIYERDRNDYIMKRKK